MVSFNRKFLFLAPFLTIISINANLNAQVAASPDKATSDKVLVQKKPHRSSLTKKIKSSQKITNYIDPNYFLEVDLNQSNCEKTIEGQCLFRDHFLEDPYFHTTKLIIFQNKILALQNISKNDDNQKLMQVKSSLYKLSTINGNFISFYAKKGQISDLILQKGDLAREKYQNNKCYKSKILYDYYELYDKKSQLFEETAIFRDEFNFDGLKEYIVFVEKNNLNEIMVLAKNVDQTQLLENAHLCKIANQNELLFRYTTKEECQKIPQGKECKKYQNCEDHLIVENCQTKLFKGDLQ